MQTPGDAEKDRAGVAPQDILSSSHPKVRSKRCPSCGKKKPVKDFPESTNAADGRFIYCAKCYKGYQKNEYFLPRICWIRGRHSAVIDERDALLNFFTDVAIINEFMGRCYSFQVRQQKGGAEARDGWKSIPVDPNRQCTRCGSGRTYIRSHYNATGGKWRTYYLWCHDCQRAGRKASFTRTVRRRWARPPKPAGPRPDAQ
jgi:hypothetical protein